MFKEVQFWCKRNGRLFTCKKKHIVPFSLNIENSSDILRAWDYFNLREDFHDDLLWSATVERTDIFILDNDQRDAHLLYFTTYLLHSSTCFEHYMLIIRSMNCIDTAFGIFTFSQWPSGASDGH